MIGSVAYFPPETLSPDVGACPGVPAAIGTAAAWLFVGGSVCYTLGALLTLGVVATLTYQDTESGGAAASSATRAEIFASDLAAAELSDASLGADLTAADSGVFDRDMTAAATGLGSDG